MRGRGGGDVSPRPQGRGWMAMGVLKGAGWVAGSQGATDGAATGRPAPAGSHGRCPLDRSAGSKDCRWLRGSPTRPQLSSSMQATSHPFPCSAPRFAPRGIRPRIQLSGNVQPRRGVPGPWCQPQVGTGEKCRAPGHPRPTMTSPHMPGTGSEARCLDGPHSEPCPGRPGSLWGTICLGRPGPRLAGWDGVPQH